MSLVANDFTISAPIPLDPPVTTTISLFQSNFAGALLLRALSFAQRFKYQASARLTKAKLPLGSIFRASRVIAVYLVVASNAGWDVMIAVKFSVLAFLV
jgi:hypothetical protein